MKTKLNIIVYKIIIDSCYLPEISVANGVQLICENVYYGLEKFSFQMNLLILLKNIKIHLPGVSVLCSSRNYPPQGFQWGGRLKSQRF